MHTQEATQRVWGPRDPLDRGRSVGQGQGAVPSFLQPLPGPLCPLSKEAFPFSFLSVSPALPSPPLSSVPLVPEPHGAAHLCPCWCPPVSTSV